MTKQLKPEKGIHVQTVKIAQISALVLSPEEPVSDPPGILWIHGGGYITGMKEMVYMSRAMDLVKQYKAIVISPGYRLAFQKPYPAALDDCYDTLLYMKEYARELGFRKDQIMVGGESAGGGLAAAVCIRARDEGKVRIAFQMPLYPMLNNLDTESSKDNHGKVWNTRKNHFGWRMYLRENAKKTVSPYAAAAHETDFRNLPPCYTFVGDGEPFYKETLEYVENLKSAGVEATVDVYPTDVHAFDMMHPQEEISEKAVATFREHFAYALNHYFAENE